MEEIAKANPSLNTDLLYSQANYYYTFGLNSQGDAAINKLIDRYQQEKDYGKANDCYRQLIEMATRNGNARLVARTYDRYNHWSALRTCRSFGIRFYCIDALCGAQSQIKEKYSCSQRT